MNNRITSDNITKLKPNEIFVFGSNLSGRHGAGAAKFALKFGAIYGCGVGIAGMTYAIPTKDKFIRTLSLDNIQIYVNEFIELAKNNNHLTFLVTEIGCRLAGYTHNDIAPLFKEAINIENIYLPQKFWNVLLNN